MSGSIEVHKRTVQWAKNAFLLNDSEIQEYLSDGLPVLYSFSMYPKGGGDDRIVLLSFNRVLTDDEVNSRFADKKVGGQVFGGVCMVDLRESVNE